MDMSDIRLLTHWLLFAFITAIVIAVILARGRAIMIRRLNLVASSLTMFGLWVLLLAVSVKGNAFIARDTIVPALVALEAAGTFFGWWWFLLSIRATFCIAHKSAGVGMVG